MPVGSTTDSGGLRPDSGGLRPDPGGLTPTQRERLNVLNRRIYLIGFMAAGKSAVGSALAGIQGYRFEDLDSMIEECAGAKVHEIFERRGEAWFRDREHECLKRTEELENVVIATGGGTTTFERNRAVIGRLGVSVWLDPPLEVLLERLERGTGSKRPLFRSREQARMLYHNRLDAYRMSDLRVEPSFRDTADDVAASIAARLRERNCVT